MLKSVLVTRFEAQSFSHLKNLSMLKLAFPYTSALPCFSHLKNLSMLKYRLALR